MLFDKSQKKSCKKCFGTGFHDNNEEDPCEACNATGIYIDDYYIVESNKLAIDSDLAGK